MLEKKLESKIFCNNACRSKWDKQTGGVQRLCRDRQNAWIKNHTEGKYYTVQKFQCEKCANTEKGGNCNILIEINRKLL